MDAKNAESAAKAIETALVKQPVIDESRTLDLANALTALAARMDAKDATAIAAGCSQTVAKALDKPEEMESKKLSLLGCALERLSPLISNPSIARQTQLVALSNVLLSKAILDPPKPGAVEPKELKQLAELYATLGPQDLAEVLKWPFCVGEAQQMALAELEKKTGGKFDGKYYAVTGDATADMRSYKMVDANTLDLSQRKASKVVSSGRIVVSGDGKSRTVTTTGTDAKGKKFKNVGVYDKK
jgi:hypothetical protein